MYTGEMFHPRDDKIILSIRNNIFDVKTEFSAADLKRPVYGKKKKKKKKSKKKKEMEDKSK